ncbi:MAG: glycine cleavage system aminomethyltransferase GcvT [Planctomycetota bacterium]
MDTPPLHQTPLHGWHVDHGAKMVPFAGWSMPVSYGSVIEEHTACRTGGALFDVSHMGRLRFTGPDAGTFLETVFTRCVTDLADGQSRYGFITNERGGIKDDVIVGREGDDYPIVVNASNREKLLSHFETVKTDRGLDVSIDDRTAKTAMLALQGPHVIEKFADILPIDLDLRGLKRFRFETVSYMLMKFTVSRTGYTGEDGVEVTLPAKACALAMRGLGSALKDWLRPAGLAARDTLRIEAAMPLYGHEIDEETDPITAGLGWACDLSRNFIGADALRGLEPAQKVVGLELDGKRIARQGNPISLDGNPVGIVTSGTMSPTLGKSIAMAKLDIAHTEPGTVVHADFKNGLVPARVVALPFYKRA